MLLPIPGLVPAHASSPVPGPVVPRLRTQLGPLPMRSIKGAPPPRRINRRNVPAPLRRTTMTTRRRVRRRRRRRRRRKGGRGVLTAFHPAAMARRPSSFTTGPRPCPWSGARSGIHHPLSKTRTTKAGCAVLFFGQLPREHRGGGPGLAGEAEKEEDAILLPGHGLVPTHAPGPAPGPVVPRLRTKLGPLPTRSTKAEGGATF